VQRLEGEQPSNNPSKAPSSLTGKAEGDDIVQRAEKSAQI